MHWKTKIRPEQIGWHLRRARAGGRSFILTRRTCWRPGCEDELWLHPGGSAAVLAAGGLRQVDPLLVSEGGPSEWDWEALLRCLAAAPGGSR